MHVLGLDSPDCGFLGPWIFRFVDFFRAVDFLGVDFPGRGFFLGLRISQRILQVILL